MMIGWMASQPHYGRHLAPILDRLRNLGHETVDTTTDAPVDTPVIVASRSDAEKVMRHRRPRRLILVEHGAGQRYFHPARGGWMDASGGQPDPNVTLFLAPSQRVADLMESKLPNAARVVVGSPAVEELARMRSERTAGSFAHVFTCHWQMTPIGVREGGTSFPWSLKVLDRMDPALTVVHGHPRIQARLATHAAKRGFPSNPHWLQCAMAADLLVADNTSVMWEALTLGIPVVAVTPPGWSDDAPHGFPRFGPTRIRLPTIHDAAHTRAVIDTALGSPVGDPGVYEVVDGATDLAVSVILSHVVD